MPKEVTLEEDVETNIIVEYPNSKQFMVMGKRGVIRNGNSLCLFVPRKACPISLESFISWLGLK